MVRTDGTIQISTGVRSATLGYPLELPQSAVLEVGSIQLIRLLIRTIQAIGHEAVPRRQYRFDETTN